MPKSRKNTPKKRNEQPVLEQKEKVLAAQKAASIFIQGTAFDCIANGIYMSGIALFLLYHSNGQGLIYFANILGIAFLWECIAEVPGGYIADRLGRKAAVVTGYFLNSIAFAVFLSIPFIRYSDTNTKWWLLLLAEIIYKSGNALVSGAFESWTIGKIKESNPNYQTDRLFAQVLFWERLGLLVGCVLFAIMYYFYISDPKSGERLYLWAFPWFAAFMLYGGLAIWLQSTMERIEYYTREGRKLTIKLWWSAIKSPHFLSTTIVYAGWYSIGLIIMYMWPTIVSGAAKNTQYENLFKSLFPIAILLVGSLGSYFNTLISKKVESIGRNSYLLLSTQRITLTMFGISLETFFLLISVAVATVAAILGQHKGIFFVAVVALLLSRMASRISVPFILATFHSSITDERVRSIASSSRIAAGSFVAGVIFLGKYAWPGFGVWMVNASKAPVSEINKAAIGLYFTMAFAISLTFIFTCFAIYWMWSTIYADID